MGFPPDVYLVGAMKAGTTSLALMLDQHPKIIVSKPKEPNYFTINYANGEAWYASCFQDHAGRICIDASTSYSKAPVDGAAYSESSARLLGGVPERIARLRPDAKFIYILREPVARIYSDYNHNVRAGWETRSFAEAVRREPEYLCSSNYVGQIRMYREHFPREAMLILLFEDFRKDPHAVARRCFEFLGVDPDCPVELDRAVNVGFLYTGLGRRLQRAGLIDLMSKLFPNAMGRLFAPLVSRPIPPMRAEDKTRLMEYFAPLNEELARETGLDLSAWAAGGGCAG